MLRLTRCGKCATKTIRMMTSKATTTSEITRDYQGSIKRSPYEHGHHRSNAEELVNKVPVIEVDGMTAVCDGGGGALGHPVEYIQLNTISKNPAICKYCGLRFKSTHVHH